MAKTTPKAKNSAFMKPMQPSEHLAKIVGTEPLPRTEVTKKIWAHIKKHHLQNPKNKREILADDKLQPIFGTKAVPVAADAAATAAEWCGRSRLSEAIHSIPLGPFPQFQVPTRDTSCCKTYNTIDARSLPVIREQSRSLPTAR
jgi:upstream activation factor subunit UAF30